MLDKGMIKRGFLRERIVPDFLINDSLFTTIYVWKIYVRYYGLLKFLIMKFYNFLSHFTKKN